MSGRIQPDRLRKLVHKLVDIYSPSGKEEEIVDYLHGYLRRKGLPVRRQQVDERRENLIVAQPGHEPLLGFVGHLDTVTAYDLERYGYREEGDLILGLGAADMKGACAALVEATIGLWEQGGPGPPVALALVVGEEEEGDGAAQLVKEYHFPWAIIGEPTDLRPCLSNFGYLEMQVCLTGERKHASLANRANNPVEGMLNLLLNITNHLSERRPELVYNIRDLFSSQAGFIVPERCEAWIDVHLPPESLVGEIVVELEEFVSETDRERAGIDTTVRFETVDGGYVIPEKGLLVEALRCAMDKHRLSWSPKPFRSHSDANQLWAAGIKPILLGPGQLERAHVPAESVSFEQVCLAAELYYDVAVSLLQRIPGAFENS